MIAIAAIPFTRQPASRGRFWFARAFAMFNAHRTTWILLLLAYYAITVLVQRLVPVVGPLAWVLLKPVFAVGFLAAAWNQERGIAPRVSHLFEGFRANLWALMPLGVVFVAGISLALLASTLVDGGRLIAIATGAEPLSEEAFEGGRVQAAMLLSGACAVPVILALWFAPALVVFNDAGTVSALVTSLRACLANWRPILVYSAILFVLAVFVPATLGIAMRLVPDWAATVVTVLVLVPYMIAFIATLHVCDYVIYRDVFHADELLAAPATRTHSA